MTPSSEQAPPPTPGDDGRTALASRCHAIEEAYEFMLAYAAQGLPSDEGSVSGGQIRDFLRKCDAALAGIGDAITQCVQRLSIEPLAPYSHFIEVVDRDARDAQTAVQLVLAQRSIGSQLIDNLNASTHLRTVLTDLFLLEEVLKI
jgi:hypothetical protein